MKFLNSKTYESVQGIGKTGQSLDTFGEAQNQFNADVLKELRIMQLQNNMLLRQMTEAHAEIAKLKEDNVRYTLKLSKCQAELESLKQGVKTADKYQEELNGLKKEIDRLKLTARLNTNAIERLTRNDDNTNADA